MGKSSPASDIFAVVGCVWILGFLAFWGLIIAALVKFVFG